MTRTEAFRRLEDIYAEFDRRIAGVRKAGDARCRACGRCCDFSTHAHRLFASRIEREYLDLPEGELPDSNACPFLDGTGRCARYAHRTLGCRAYRCDAPREEADARAALYEEFRGRLASLSAEAGLAWDYRQVLPRLTSA